MTVTVDRGLQSQVSWCAAGLATDESLHSSQMVVLCLHSFVFSNNSERFSRYLGEPAFSFCTSTGIRVERPKLPYHKP